MKNSNLTLMATLMALATRSICFLTVAMASMFTAGISRANVLDLPPHAHGLSPVTTFPSGGAPPNKHQHRTFHDVSKGTGHPARNYEADSTWMDNTYHVIGDGHPEFGHGHMDKPARYAIHGATAGGRITANTSTLWNTFATTRTFEAFNGVNLGGGHIHDGWNPVGNQSGPRNWPGSDNDETLPNGEPNGVPWHSTVNFLLVAESSDHDFHVRLVDPDDPNGTTALGEWDDKAGGAGARAGLNVLINADPIPVEKDVDGDIIKENDVDWFFGTSHAGDLDKYDLATVLLHETGHTLGFLHFGNRGMGDIMDITNVNGLDLRGAAGTNILHTISQPTVHGVLDLYSIVPEPSTLLLFGSGLAALLGLGRRRSLKKP